LIALLPQMLERSSTDPVHAILALTSLTMLLQLDDNKDKNRGSGPFPLTFLRCSKPGLITSISGITSKMACLFDPKKPHPATWTEMHDMQGTVSQNIPTHPRQLLYCITQHYAISADWRDALIIIHVKDARKTWSKT
jgi:hypothetical protein